MTFNEAKVKLMIDFFNRNCENPQDNEWNDQFKALKENKISKQDSITSKSPSDKDKIKNFQASNKQTNPEILHPLWKSTT